MTTPITDMLPCRLVSETVFASTHTTL